MKRIILAVLFLITIANLLILVIALTNKSSEFYNYRSSIIISLLMFSGMLRRQFLSNRNNLEK